MKRIILFALCMLPFVVGGLTIDCIVGANLGFLRLFAIDVVVYLSIVLSNMIYVGFTRNPKELAKNEK